MTEISEIWIDIPDYEGLYQVSNLGRVKSLQFGKEKMLKLYLGDKGYYTIFLTNAKKVKKNWMVSRLVWEAFNGKTNLFIDHKVEGNKLDNRLSNLQAITPRQNISKYRQSTKKTSKYVGVSFVKKTNQWKAQIALKSNKNYVGLLNSEVEAHNDDQKALTEINTKTLV